MRDYRGNIVGYTFKIIPTEVSCRALGIPDVKTRMRMVFEEIRDKKNDEANYLANRDIILGIFESTIRNYIPGVFFAIVVPEAYSDYKISDLYIFGHYILVSIKNYCINKGYDENKCLSEFLIEMKQLL